MFRSLHGRTERIDLGAAALDSEALRDLRAKLSGSTASARVVVLWCVGPLAGFDLAEVCAAAARSDLTPARIFAECLMAIREADIPVIAAVDGKIMGGSVGIIAACDIVIAGAGAVFQLPEVIAGMVPALIWRDELGRRALLTWS
jgi:enoyl-CoA hydratase/carnithine racemase